MLFLQRHLHVIVRNGFNFLIHVFMLVNVFVQHPLFKLKCTSTYFLTFNTYIHQCFIHTESKLLDTSE